MIENFAEDLNLNRRLTGCPGMIAESFAQCMGSVTLLKPHSRAPFFYQLPSHLTGEGIATSATEERPARIKIFLMEKMAIFLFIELQAFTDIGDDLNLALLACFLLVDLKAGPNPQSVLKNITEGQRKKI
eukprot:TRINITY_DN65045_c0_g1_i1.p2 TRINITY_DN65045_c0_g1~~TRINITY_DN65045_c0_g1_i1.p2  ORF type:complete len:130 (-),score=10.73 TRINITY_DN65045_c0_g1_i1:442-831(-)